MARTIDLAIPTLSGKLAVVTGASDGIGFVIASRLAQAGAEVIMPVRNAAKGTAAADRIQALAPGGTVSTRPLDLSSLASVSTFAQGLIDEGRPINILINNAGVMQPPTRQETQDGFELQFGTNYLSHFVLTQELLPLLREGRAHVTTQSSVAARNAAMNWDDLTWDRGYDVGKAYGQSKLACALFARELDARSKAAGWGITSNFAHPGVSPTNLLAAQPGMGRQRDTAGIRAVRLLSRLGIAGTPQSAALPALLAATGPDSRGDQFFGPQGIGNLGGTPGLQELWKPMRSMDDAHRLWADSQRLVGLNDPAPELAQFPQGV